MDDKYSKVKDRLVPGSSFFALVIALSPILGQYASMIPGVSLADIFLGASCIILLLLNRKYKIDKSKAKLLILFWFYAVFISMFSFFVQQNLSLLVLTRIIRTSFFIFVILLTHKNVNQKLLIKIYKIISLVAAGYIIAQFVVYNLSGILLPFKLLPMPWMDGRVFGINEALGWAERWYLRPSAFFLEPGYAAQYLFPALVFALFGWANEKRKMDVKSVILIFTALILTTSSQGIYIGVIILFLYFMLTVKKKYSYITVIKNIILSVAFFISSFIFINSNVFQRSMNYIIGNTTAGGSTAFRVLRGPAVFIEIPPLYNFIGVGHGNIGEFVFRNNISTSYDPLVMTLVGADYVNGISTVLLYYGIGGLFLWLWFMYALFRGTNVVGKLILIAFFILMFVSGTFISYNTILYFALIYSCLKNNGHNHRDYYL